jgi:hypothetical protein
MPNRARASCKSNCTNNDGSSTRVGGDLCGDGAGRRDQLRPAGLIRLLVPIPVRLLALGV